jgi:ABC-2 type transport system ATP-binding protein
LQILAAQAFETAGTVSVFGRHPYEDDDVLSRICLVKESQKYPDAFTVRQVVHAAQCMFAEWDDEFAKSLLAEFALPQKRKVKHLSRGMLSALGITVGLASRAPLTCFDEPYLGLDAVARHLFYDRLLADFGEHPRTIILSTHLIDEISQLIERVLLIDHGVLIADEETESLRATAVTVTGPAAAVLAFTRAYEELHRESLGGFARVTVSGPVPTTDRAAAGDLGLSLEPVSLQELVVRRTTRRAEQAAEATKEAS